MNLPSPKPLFSIGQLLATPAALRALLLHGIAYQTLLRRHAHGDWGDVSKHDREQNELALQSGGRLMSAYALSDAKADVDPSREVPKIWLITDADRTCTSLLLPEDY